MSVFSEEGSGPSRHAEATLWEQAQRGCPESLRLLMKRHERLVVAVVRQQVLGQLPYPVALHAGRIGLWRAIRGYDPGRGIAFSTYAWPSIMRLVWAAVNEYGQEMVAQPAWEGVAPVSSGGEDPAEVWERLMLRRALEQALGRLPGRLQAIVQSHYGWDGQPAATFAEIGQRLGITRQRAEQLHQEGLLRLRQPAVAYELWRLLERQDVAAYEATARETGAYLRRRRGR